jgi:methylmalonyl-CoA/ethylmalonyl-CoA epimerase
MGDELVTEQETLTVMFGTRKSGGTPPSGERLEVLIPAPAGAGPIAKFLEKKGSGIHHVALTVEGIDALLVSLKAKGVRLIDETPRHGAHHTRIAFVHPESTGGLLVELVEPQT